MQTDILKETNTYSQTRYSIITTSLQKIIQDNDDFRDLLLLISLMDSQDMPRDLLNAYKDPAVVDNFIYHLNQYSFITHTSAHSNPISTFSIHRGVQDVMLSYLTSTLNLHNNQQPIKSIACFFEGYLANMIKDERMAAIHILRTHLEHLLNKARIVSKENKIKLMGTRGFIVFLLGDETQARQIMDNVLHTFENFKHKDYTLIARTLLYYGIMEEHQSNCQHAQDYLNKSLGIYNELLPDNKEDISWILMKLGVVHDKMCNYDKAINFLKQSITMRETLFSADDVKLCLPKLYLAIVYVNRGAYTKAENLFTHCLEQYEKTYGKIYRKYANTLVYLGLLKHKLGFDDQAKALLVEAVEICKTIHSDEAIFTAWASVNLAYVLQDMGEVEDAAKLIEKSLVAYKKIYDDTHIPMAWVHHCLGLIYEKQHDFKDSEKLLSRTLNIYQKEYGRKHLKTAYFMQDLGHLYLLQNKLDESEQLFQEALRITQDYKHPDAYIILEYLSELYCKRAQQMQELQQNGKVHQQTVYQEKSIDSLNQALTIVKESFPSDSPHIVRIEIKKNNLIHR